MTRWILGASLGVALASFGSVSGDADASTFSDATCPQANASGGDYNRLVANASVTNDELLGPALGLAAAYGDCVKSYERIVGTNDGELSDYIVVDRAYSRLQLAKAFERVAVIDASMKDFAGARDRYEAALVPLGQIDGMISFGDPNTSGSEPALLAQARATRDRIVANEANLPKEPS